MNWLFLPPWNVRMIAAIAAGLLAIAIVRRWRERRGSKTLLLRAAIIGLLLGVMLNPQLLISKQHSEKPRLSVLIDSSLSMGTADVNGESRYSAAVKILTAPVTREKLTREFAVDVRQFDRSVRSTDISQLAATTPAGNASDIGSAISKVVSEIGDVKSQAGILVISDGRATEPDTLDAAQLALAQSVPLWTCTLGGPVPHRDLRMETSSSEVLAFSGQETELNATLHADGYSGRSFKVDLIKDGNVIATTNVLPNAKGMGRVSFTVKAPDAEEQRYLFRAAALPDESDTANNERAVFMRAIGKKIRVLIVEGQPHWDTKFLVQSLKRNTNIDLTAVYRLNAGRHVSIVSTGGSETRSENDLFPRTSDAMDAFDVIILGHEAEAFFNDSTESLLTGFVSKRGGNLIFARGKSYGGRFPALAKFEPVAWGDGYVSDVKLVPGEAARENPIFNLGPSGTFEELLDRLPALDSAAVTFGEKPLAVVLAKAGQSQGPVLMAYQRYGQGKTVSVNAGGLWHWAFRETGQEESEAAYQRFWISMLQWLLGGNEFQPGADIGLASSRRYYNSDQPMQFLISTRNIDRAAYRPLLSISGNGKTVEIEPRTRGESYIAEAGPFDPGTYTVTLKNNVGTPSVISQSIEVVSASIEKQELSADPDTMKKLAEISNGRTVTPQDIARLPEIVRQWEASRELSTHQQPLWDRWWILGLFLCLIGGEWWLRRKEGLL